MIGKNVEIGNFTTICEDVEIGDGCQISNNVTIFPGARTVLRECTTVHRGTASKGKTVVGSNCLIMAYTHIAHDCRLGNNIIISNATQLAGEVVVDDYAVISPT